MKPSEDIATLGTLRWRPSRPGAETGAWYIDMRDGRPWERIPADVANHKSEREAADRYRREFRATMARLKATPKDTRETVARWFDRYYDAAEEGLVGRKNRGKAQAAVEDRRARFRVHIAPHIGTMAMLDVRPEHLRRIVARLDEQIRTRLTYLEDAEDIDGRAKPPGMAAKTAAHIWSEITGGFREARASKLDELRVLGLEDPTKDVAPPERTDERAQAALYPAELVQLLACTEVDLELRRLYAVAAYTGMRRGELQRLTAEHIDLEHNVIRVPGTKSAAARRHTPIEPALRPLLELLCAARPSGPLLKVPNDEGKGTAALVRLDMRTAKLTRPELWRDDADHRAFTFHGLRHTAVTHAYLAGRDSTWLRTAYGHTSSEMTRRYLDSAAMARSTFGAPFPPLPADVTRDVTAFSKCLKSQDNLRRGRDSNPRSAFDRRSLSKRVPSATRSPLLSGWPPIY